MDKQKLFQSLKSQVESQNVSTENKRSKIDQEIFVYKRGLFENKVEKDFSYNLGEIIPSESEIKMGPHGHTRSVYNLSWEKSEKTFDFFVTNTKANKKFPLLKCPEYVKEECFKLLDPFLEIMAKKIKS